MSEQGAAPAQAPAAAEPQVSLPGISPGSSGRAPQTPKTIDQVVDAVVQQKEGGAANDNAESAEAPAIPAELAAALAPLKVGDKEIKVASIEELRARAQKGVGAEERFEAAARLERETKAQHAQLQQQLAQLESLFKTPEGLLRIARHTLGAQADDALIEIAHSVIEERTLPPEERARRQQERELRTKAQRLEQLEAQQRQQAQTAQEAQLTASYEQQAQSALKSVGLAVDDYTLERWAIEMQMQIDAGVRQPDPALAARKVQERLGAGSIAHLKALPPEQLLAALEPVLPTIRKLDAERLRAKQKNVGATPAPPRDANGRFQPSNGAPKQSTSEWLHKLLGY